MDYATTLEHPPPEDFAQRMRNIALPPKKQPKNNKTAAGRPDNVLEVTSLQDYKSVVADETEKIVAVRFYAPWCRACKAAAPSFYRVARELQDKVKFVDVPVTKESSKIHQGLEIPAIPYSHIYMPGEHAGLVEELRMSRPRFPQFEEALKSYVDGYCEIEDFDYRDPRERESEGVEI